MPLCAPAKDPSRKEASAFLGSSSGLGNSWQENSGASHVAEKRGQTSANDEPASGTIQEPLIPYAPPGNGFCVPHDLSHVLLIFGIWFP
jgi:hypothetical protein